MTRSSLFTRAYTARKSVNTPLFTLYVLPKNNRPGSKSAVGVSIPKESTRNGSGSQAVDKMPLVRMPLVGFVISKKVCKSACQRNRAKRRVREAYRTMRKEMVESVQRLEQWYALVFVLNNKALEANWEEIRGSVAGCLSKADSKFGMGTRERKPS